MIKNDSRAESRSDFVNASDRSVSLDARVNGWKRVHLVATSLVNPEWTLIPLNLNNAIFDYRCGRTFDVRANQSARRRRRNRLGRERAKEKILRISDNLIVDPRGCRAINRADGDLPETAVNDSAGWRINAGHYRRETTQFFFVMVALSALSQVAPLAGGRGRVRQFCEPFYEFRRQTAALPHSGDSNYARGNSCGRASNISFLFPAERKTYLERREQERERERETTSSR